MAKKEKAVYTAKEVAQLIQGKMFLSDIYCLPEDILEHIDTKASNDEFGARVEEVCDGENMSLKSEHSKMFRMLKNIQNAYVCEPGDLQEILGDGGDIRGEADDLFDEIKAGKKKRKLQEETNAS